VTTVFHGKGGESRTYETPVEYYETHETLHNYYERSLHADQPAYVAVLCEAAGMVPMIGRAVRNYRVEVASSSGFDSLTVKYDLFRDALYRYEVFGQKTILLHLGDHDPSGWSRAYPGGCLRVSGKWNCRRLDSARLQGFEASGCLPALFVATGR
jgi:hypothetical protein